MENCEVKIREFKHEDLEQILNFNGKFSKRRQDKFQRVELLDSYYAFVAEKDKDIVGFIVMEDLADDSTHHMIQIDVADDYKRKGIGTLLVNHVFEYLAGKRITLNVNTDNFPAINFYKSVGFEECGSCSHYRENQNKLWYTKKIS
jgi:ribosomal protein S18 acetylase RimI-like enzyme